MTVSEIISRYLAHCAVEGVHCPEARSDRVRTFRLFCEACGTLEVAACKPFHLTDFIESHPSWKSVSTRRAKANEIRAAFQWAADGERIDKNPFAKVKYAEAERRPDLPDECLERIATLANKRFEAILIFLRLTGCRLGEACAATWGDVDLERGIWTIHRHKSRRYTGRPKEIALVGECVDLLRAIFRAGADATFPIGVTVLGDVMPAHANAIFTNARGKPWNRRTLGQQFRRLKLRHGITSKATLHGVRHRAATAMLGNGAPMLLVAEQLGHASTAITQRYYWHRSEEHLAAIKAAVELGLPPK